MRNLTVFLTGGTGFVGQYINQFADLNIINADFDIRDYQSVNEAFSGIEPDWVIHLAAQSFVPRSFDNPQETFDINFGGTFNLLSVLKKHNFKGRLLFVGSGDVYGVIEEQKLPIIENQPLKPRNPYSVSKVAAEALCYQWSQTEAFEVVMVRPFNHIGPGQSDMFVVSDFAKQITQIKLGLKKPELQVGDIDITRDFTDVRDVIKAYRLLLQKGVNGEVYNICSGKETSIRVIIDTLCRLSNVDVEIKQEKSRLRISENRRIFGNSKKLKEVTGWQPEILLEQSLKDILEDWEQKLK